MFHSIRRFKPLRFIGNQHSGLGLWAIAASLVVVLPACSNVRRVAPTPPPELPTPAPTVEAPSPNPTVFGDPFERGVTKAASATTLAKDAQTADDWDLVISQWEQAIALMKAVPANHPKRTTAQKLAAEYQQSLGVARQQAKSGFRPDIGQGGKGGKGGIPLIAGGEVVQDKTTEAISSISNLIQFQSTFFTKQKRFAANLAELGKNAPSDSPNYSYNTISLQANQAIVTAIAKQPGLPSYTGALFILKDEKNSDIPLSAICATQQPSQAPPPAPQLVGKELKCAEGSVRQ